MSSRKSFKHYVYNDGITIAICSAYNVQQAEEKFKKVILGYTGNMTISRYWYDNDVAILTGSSSQNNDRHRQTESHSHRISIPPAAIDDAKKLLQWSSGNICYGDSYFDIAMENKWGEEIWYKACDSVTPIPIPEDEYNDR